MQFVSASTNKIIFTLYPINRHKKVTNCDSTKFYIEVFRDSNFKNNVWLTCQKTILLTGYTNRK